MRFQLARSSLRFVGRRQASTSTQSAAQQAQQTAQQTAQAAAEKAKVVADKAKVVGEQAFAAAEKGMEGLKKAGDIATGYLNTASKSGGRIGKIAQTIEAAIPPTVYYSKVALELGKIMWRERAMSPPQFNVIKDYWANLYRNAGPKINSINPAEAVAKVRGVSKAQAVTYGVIAAELLGFFTVGEIIGKQKIIGYRHKIEAHH